MSLFDDTYQTISAPSEGIFRDKGSKFVGYAFPIIAEKDVKIFLSQVKEQHPKARHFCWAYRFTPDRNYFKINDDGEPSGTAGRPILNTLLSADLTNVFVVVVRYFGGTLLGVPGLINAYKMATKEALGQTEVVEKTINNVYQISFDYLQMNDVMRVVKEDILMILSQNFDASCEMHISIRKNETERIVTKLQKIENLKANYLHTA